MNAADVVGYTYEGEFYCPDCFDDGGDCDDDEVGVVFADSEWDSYPTCTTCGEQCEDVSLTTGGERAETERRGPEEDDYTTSDYVHWYQSGKLVVTVGEGGRWQDVVGDHASEEGYWPNMWVVSDHGNSHLLTLDDLEAR